jgi:hypothetical protein
VPLSKTLLSNHGIFILNPLLSSLVTFIVRQELLPITFNCSLAQTESFVSLSHLKLSVFCYLNNIFSFFLHRMKNSPVKEYQWHNTNKNRRENEGGKMFDNRIKYYQIYTLKLRCECRKIFHRKRVGKFVGGVAIF